MSDVTQTDELNADLIDRLGRLGNDIDRELGATDLAEATLDAIDTSPTRTRHRPWAVAASLLLIVMLGVLVIPDSRRAVARWFGIPGVQIEIEPRLSLPPPIGVTESVGPGESRVLDVDGREILVSAIDASLEAQLITKTVSASDQLEQVEVNGAPGLWIGGESHEVLYRVAESEVVVERVAANTLLWNDGDLLYRIEGFDRLDDALAFVRADFEVPAIDE